MKSLGGRIRESDPSETMGKADDVGEVTGILRTLPPDGTGIGRSGFPGIAGGPEET